MFLQITGKRQPESPLQTPNLLAHDLAWISHSPGLREISVCCLSAPSVWRSIAAPLAQSKQTKPVSFHTAPSRRQSLCVLHWSTGGLGSAFMKKSVYINSLGICTIFSKTCQWQFSVLLCLRFTLSFYFTIDILALSSQSHAEYGICFVAGVKLWVSDRHYQYNLRICLKCKFPVFTLESKTWGKAQ